MYGLLPSQKKAKEGSAPHFKAQTSSHKNIHLSTCKVDRESLSIFFTWHHHCPGQLLAAPTSTIPWSQCMYNIHCSLRVKKKETAYRCPDISTAASKMIQLTYPQADGTQACQLQAPGQTICIATPSPHWWTLTAEKGSDVKSRGERRKHPNLKFQIQCDTSL